MEKDEPFGSMKVEHVVLIQSSIRCLQAQRAFETLRKIFILLRAHKKGLQSRRRSQKFFELVSTEKSYLEKLDTIVEVFMIPLKERQIIRDDQIKLIFSDVEAIRRYLRFHLHNGSREESTECFTRIFPLFVTHGIQDLQRLEISSLLRLA